MKQYETTIIVNPVLPGDESKQVAENLYNFLRNDGCQIIDIVEWGVRQMAFQMNRYQSGAYYTVEFTTDKEDLVSRMELAIRREERIIRYLTVRLDKFGIKYNEDKRAGLIGRKRRQLAEEIQSEAEAENIVTGAAAGIVPNN